MKIDKAGFLSLVHSWARGTTRVPTDIFNLDPEVNNMYNALIAAENNMIAVCKRKLEEAGIKP